MPASPRPPVTTAPCTWPDPGEPGQYVIQCSCRTWTFTGTAQEIQAASRSHDDSPGKQHIVAVAGKVVTPA